MCTMNFTILNSFDEVRVTPYETYGYIDSFTNKDSNFYSNYPLQKSPICIFIQCAKYHSFSGEVKILTPSLLVNIYNLTFSSRPCLFKRMSFNSFSTFY